jgi:hypothetical protein
MNNTSHLLTAQSQVQYQPFPLCKVEHDPFFAASCLVFLFRPCFLSLLPKLFASIYIIECIFDGEKSKSLSF